MPLLYHSGFTFPMLSLGPKGRVQYGVNNIEDLVSSSIKQIIMTMIGERMDVPDFGCRVHELHFENMDQHTLQLAQVFVAEACAKWEPRALVQMDQIQVVPDTNATNKIRIDIPYSILTPDATPGQKSVSVYL